MQLGESQNALRYYEKAIKSKPNYPDAHINLGIAFKSLKKNEQFSNSMKNQNINHTESQASLLKKIILLEN